jgi:hypothetical protein
MPDEIVEIAEGDEGSDSLMNVVLLFAFLFVCYKAAEHFGWINKPNETTGVPSGTPGTVPESVTGTVPGSGTPVFTSGTPGAIGTGAPGDEATKVPGGATKPAPAPQFTTASTSIAAAPTTATVPASASMPPDADSEATRLWSSAPDARKVFCVSMSTVSAIVGCYSYSSPGVWLKATDTASAAECSLKLTGSNAQFFRGNEQLPVSCTLSKTGTCQTNSATVEGRLRDMTGMWNGARTLQMTWRGAQTVSFVPVRLALGPEMRDVWRALGSGLLNMYLTESEFPHVGGPRMTDGYLLYEYDGKTIRHLAYWSNADRRWKWRDAAVTTVCDIVVRRVDHN